MIWWKWQKKNNDYDDDGFSIWSWKKPNNDNEDDDGFNILLGNPSDIFTHYNDVIMGAMASQITSLTIVYSTVYQAQIKENFKAPRHWPLCEEFTGHRLFPAQMASNAENVSIWWHHHDILWASFIGSLVIAECQQNNHERYE